MVKMGEIWGRNQNDKNGGDSNTHPQHMILWRTYEN